MVWRRDGIEGVHRSSDIRNDDGDSLDTPDSRIATILPRLRRLAHALVCEPAKADELVQAVLERATTEIGRLRPDIAPEIQLIRMLRNLWIEHREEWQSVLPLEPTTELEKVTQAMAALPSAQREAVALVVIDELQYRDAADIARVSLATLSERLVSGRATLAAMLVGSPA
jgi:DNA-directed RNA polymerase specialized sigma24 family protein